MFLWWRIFARRGRGTRNDTRTVVEEEELSDDVLVEEEDVLVEEEQIRTRS